MLDDNVCLPFKPDVFGNGFSTESWDTRANDAIRQICEEHMETLRQQAESTQLAAISDAKNIECITLKVAITNIWLRVISSLTSKKLVFISVQPSEVLLPSFGAWFS